MLSVERIADKIKSVKVQGAKEIAVYGLKFLRQFARKNGFGLKFEVATMILENARPTAVVLHNCVEIVKEEKSLGSIDRLLRRLQSMTGEIAVKGDKLIKKKYKIMTHCHSGEALAVIKQAHKCGKNIFVFATETDPLEQGVKTAKELARAKIKVTLITDSATGHFMNGVDMVLVGSDALRREGIVNKTGTLNLAMGAKEFQKPFYVAANSLKLDRRKKLVIEERPAKEVYKELIKPGRLKGVKIRNPAFDLVPWRYVTAVITEKGVFKPKRIQRLLR